MKVITLNQTKGGCFNSIPDRIEAEYYNSLTENEKDRYIQVCFMKHGHSEGANNLQIYAKAVKAKEPFRVEVREV